MKIDRKELKKIALVNLKKNYFRSVAVCFLIFIFVGGYSLSSYFYKPISESRKQVTNLEISNDIAMNIEREYLNFKIPEGIKNNIIGEKGVLGTVYKNSTNSGSLLFGFLNTVNQFFFEDKIISSMIILFGTILSLLYSLIIKNILFVGENRFFLENKNYHETKVNRIFYLFKIRKMISAVKPMLLCGLYTFFWFLTIVGGFIKMYSYKLVPFIVAENPSIKSKDVLTLSRKMMDGFKWQAFKFDLSFIGWEILSVLTMGISNIAFATPYKRIAEAELYIKLREEYLKKNEDAKNFLCDNNIVVNENNLDNYPVENYMHEEHESRKWIHVDYNRDYCIQSLVILFFVFSMIGWVWEVMLDLFTKGYFVNRGVLLGPWLPIYGTGGVMMLVSLKKVKQNYLVTFFSAMVLCGIVEYFTGWFLESFLGKKWWDYSGYFLNLRGRVCLEGLLVFAFGGCGIIYMMAPVLDNLITKIKKSFETNLCFFVSGIFLADVIFSSFKPNTDATIAFINFINKIL